MRRLGIVLLGLLGPAACSSTEVAFRCQTSGQCTLAGQIGSCEISGFCSFTDGSCPSGRRYGHYSGVGHADTCTECGNGKVDPGEECDDGKKNSTGSCLPTCRFNRCGDGFVRSNVEECDDGNTTDDDGCSAHCLACKGDNAFLLPATGHCYTRYDQALDFTAAANACQAERSYLVTYASGVELNAVKSRLLQGSPSSHWIGLDDAAKDDQFVWITGEPTGVSDIGLWQMGQPDPSRPDEDCAAQDSVGKASQSLCGAVLGYVCEKADFTIRPQDNHAYRAFFPGGSFDSGESVCGQLGGHLAVINDAEEQNFIRSQFSGLLRIGATSSPNGPPTWVTGDPMTYQNFAPGEPDGRDGPCVILGIDGLWRDRNCDTQTGFVCEVE